MLNIDIVLRIRCWMPHFTFIFILCTNNIFMFMFHCPSVFHFIQFVAANWMGQLVSGCACSLHTKNVQKYYTIFFCVCVFLLVVSLNCLSAENRFNWAMKSHTNFNRKALCDQLDVGLFYLCPIKCEHRFILPLIILFYVYLPEKQSLVDCSSRWMHAELFFLQPA